MTEELATLEQLKAALSISATDTSRDVDLTTALIGATRHVLARTRYALVPRAVTEIHEHVLEGSALWSKLRPIDTGVTVTARARVLGSSDWTDVVADVVDAQLGKVKIIGVTASLRIWPPPTYPGGLVRRNRMWRWPILELGYTTAEPDGLEDLELATASMAAFLIREAERGSSVLETVGQVTEQYAAPTPGIVFPPGLEALISGHVWPKVRLAS